LLSGDGDFGLLFVVHFDHETGFEPGNHFLDVVNVDEIGAVWAPEGVGGNGFVKFLEGAVVRGAFEFAGGDGDETTFDRGEDEIFGVNQEHALLGLDEDFVGLRGRGLGSGELGDELLEALSGADGGVDFAFGALDGFGEAGLVKRFEDVVDSVDVEGLHGVLIEGGGKDDVGNFEFALYKLFQDTETVEAGHLDVEEDEVGGMLLDEVDGFQAVFALAEEIDFREGLEEKGEFLASWFFVVDDDGVDGHGSAKLSIKAGRSEWQLRRRQGVGMEATRKQYVGSTCTGEPGAGCRETRDKD